MESVEAQYGYGMFIRVFAKFLLLLAALLATAAPAQKSEVPYWASISVSEAYMRVGPSRNYPIDWVYAREGLPVKVLRVNQGWRYVEDPDGARGWMFSAMLSRKRGAIVVGDTLAPIRAEPAETGALRWHAQPGVVGALGQCEGGWCQFETGGRVGWIKFAHLWGVGNP